MTLLSRGYQNTSTRFQKFLEKLTVAGITSEQSLIFDSDLCELLHYFLDGDSCFY